MCNRYGVARHWCDVCIHTFRQGQQTAQQFCVCLCRLLAGRPAAAPMWWGCLLSLFIFLEHGPRDAPTRLMREVAQSECLQVLRHCGSRTEPDSMRVTTGGGRTMFGAAYKVVETSCDEFWDNVYVRFWFAYLIKLPPLYTREAHQNVCVCGIPSAEPSPSLFLTFSLCRVIAWHCATFQSADDTNTCDRHAEMSTCFTG